MKLGIFLLLALLLNNNAWSAAGVASAHPVATAAGVSILQQGGNAFDAAIAITSTLAVVEPAGSGMGGGGFWLLFDAKTNKSVMLDGREKAPLSATADMYLDTQGNVIEGLSINGGLAAGIPGQPAALVWLAQNYGSLPLSKSLQPAIDAAKIGFEVTERYQRTIGWRLDLVKSFEATAKIFLLNGEIPPLGHKIVQQDLARTLEAIALNGSAGFYSGEIAEKLVQGVNQAGGKWSLQDLAQYEVAIRQPVITEYKGMEVVSAALPSSGGLVLAQSLNILENYDLTAMSDNEFTHVTVEAMRRAYHDRAEFMGDTDFVEVPIEMLVSKYYGDGLSQSIRLDRATNSEDLSPTSTDLNEGQDTTHFSVIDSKGNRVAATLSINYPYGSGVVAAGTGVLLNDEMDDFSSKPGFPNVYGLVGARANAIEPGKRMLSSMSPTFLEDKNRIAVLGTPGGSRIISMVLLGALEFHRGADAQTIVDRPRFHHQYLPDAIQYEPNALSGETLWILKRKGHKLDAKTWRWGNMHAVIMDKKSGAITAASDNRGEGLATVLP